MIYGKMSDVKYIIISTEGRGKEKIIYEGKDDFSKRTGSYENNIASQIKTVLKKDPFEDGSERYSLITAIAGGDNYLCIRLEEQTLEKVGKDLCITSPCPWLGAGNVKEAMKRTLENFVQDVKKRILNPNFHLPSIPFS